MFAAQSSIRRALAIGFVAAAGILVASACSSGYGHSAVAAGATAGAGGQPATTAPAPTSAPANGSPVTVAVGSSSKGPIVVDAAGRTLYRFDMDTAGSGASACNRACATAWPPALVTGQPTAGSGVTGTLGVITRTDGTRQVTLDGHPLYHFSGDQSPGDTTGDGFGGIWHVVHTNASPATPNASSATSTPAPAASSGYGY